MICLTLKSRRYSLIREVYLTGKEKEISLTSVILSVPRPQRTGGPDRAVPRPAVISNVSSLPQYFPALYAGDKAEISF